MGQTAPTPNSQLEETIKKTRRHEEEEKAKREAGKLGLSYLNLDTVPIDAEAIVVLPEAESRKGLLAVINKQGETITVAIGQDPNLPEPQAVLKPLFDKGFTWDTVFVSHSSLAVAWERYKEAPKGHTANVTGQIAISSEAIKQLQGEIKGIKDFSAAIDRVAKEEASKIVETIIAGSLNLDASDIHLEPKEDKTILRYRIDGVLHDAAFLSTKTYHSILSRFKLLSGMILNLHEIAQDGRFTIGLEGTPIEVRVSVIPGSYGESIVMRALNPKAINLNLEDMGFRKDIYELLEKEIRKPHGIIITTGPTGSGKTTTLYAFLKKINSPEIKIITLEDPIEYHLNGIVQTQIEAEKGYTFAAGLRAVLRQDPDVILIGEIRDQETAEIAIQSAQTGHLVFSTLHTNDASGAIPRFVVLKAVPSMLANSINIILAQRLVRRLCQFCKKEVAPNAELLSKIKKILGELPKNVEHKPINDGLKIYEASSCEKCQGTGYKGRIGIAEIIVKTPEMEELIAKNPTRAQTFKLARQQGMVTLYQDALLKVVDGISSMEEIESVVGSEEE